MAGLARGDAGRPPLIGSSTTEGGRESNWCVCWRVPTRLYKSFKLIKIIYTTGEGACYVWFSTLLCSGLSTLLSFAQVLVHLLYFAEVLVPCFLLLWFAGL